MDRTRAKKPMSAKKRGLTGAIAGLVIMAVFLLCFDAWAAGNGSQIDRTRYLGMLAVAPLYGFGYAFGYKKMIQWAADALHYSGSVMGGAFFWWILTGSRKGFLRGITFIMFLYCTIAGAAWVPGIPMGIREIRREGKARREEPAAASGKRRRSGRRTPQDRPALLHKGKFSDAVVSDSGESPEEENLYAEKGRIEDTEAYLQSEEPEWGQTGRPAAGTEIPAPLPGSRLLCFGGDFAGGCFDLSDGNPLVIGRDPGQSNIVISGRDISRAHCMVQYSTADGCALVRDLSTNGISFLDGTPVPKDTCVRVKSGDGIRIGKNGPVFLVS